MPATPLDPPGGVSASTPCTPPTPPDRLSRQGSTTPSQSLARQGSAIRPSLTAALNTGILTLPALPVRAVAVAAQASSPVAAVRVLARFWRNSLQPSPLPAAAISYQLQTNRETGWLFSIFDCWPPSYTF